jgi:hypothetical protein
MWRYWQHCYRLSIRLTIPAVENLFGSKECDDGEGIHHREDHPDVVHLDVSRGLQRLGDADETETDE